MRIFFVLSVIWLAACASLSGQNGQGVKGTTVWVTGNRMPGPDKELPAPEPVKRWIYFTPVLEMSQMPAQENGLYPTLPEDPVDSVASSKNGQFQISLPTGTYSVFTREETGFFANRFDENSRVNPVKVTENDMTEITIEINYSAVY